MLVGIVISGAKARNYSLFVWVKVTRWLVQDEQVIPHVMFVPDIKSDPGLHGCSKRVDLAKAGAIWSCKLTRLAEVMNGYMAQGFAELFDAINVPADFSCR